MISPRWTSPNNTVATPVISLVVLSLNHIWCNVFFIIDTDDGFLAEIDLFYI